MRWIFVYNKCKKSCDTTFYGLILCTVLENQKEKKLCLKEKQF